MLGVTEIHSNRSERPQDKLVAQTRANLSPPVKRISRKTPFNCFYCQKQKFEPAAIWPLWLYEDRVRDAVLTAKQAHQTALAATLGRRLATRVLELEEAPARFDFVTYVPSHITRQLVRGGNGNQILAAEVGKTLGVPCRNPLKITRRIAKQAWLGDQARIQNVRGAFSVKKLCRGRCGKLAGSAVLLVDDVMTTGATANEISRILLAAGVKTAGFGGGCQSGTVFGRFTAATDCLIHPGAGSEALYDFVSAEFTDSQQQVFHQFHQPSNIADTESS